MFVTRAPQEAIDRYAGPYERWVFSPELGRPFAFPAIAAPSSKFHSAILEGDATLTPSDSLRLPPLWEGTTPRTVTPFAFFDPNNGSDSDLAQVLGQISGQSGASNPHFRVNFPISEAAWVADDKYRPNKAMRNWVAPATQPKAIVAVIDDGLPFGNPAFLDANGKTRISHCWLQSARAKGNSAVPFGREFQNGKIDNLRAAHPDDDAAFYRKSGAIAPELPEIGTHLRRGATHGSHVLGTAAGNANMFGDHVVGDDVQIIAVQLPNTIAWDTSGFGKEMYMLSAIHYVFERAAQIAAQYPSGPDELPLVVNFSYGWSAGRHDGKSVMETAIEALLKDRQAIQPATAFVMPTGNNYASRMHARIEDRHFDNDEAQIGWKLLPDDQTSSYLEMWLPEGADVTGYTVTVTPPSGTTLSAGGTIPISADPGPHEPDTDPDIGDPRRFTELEINHQNIGQLSVDQHHGNRWRILLAMAPTAYVRDQTRRAPVGQWTVTISRPATATLGTDQAIHVWAQRDDDPISLHTNGRQSYLVDPNDPADTPHHPIQQFSESLDQMVRGYGALNGVASSSRTTRVAGYVATSGRPSGYSASGGLFTDSAGVQTWGAQTDVAAVSDLSALHPGTPSIGVNGCSGSRLTGTSGAAPAVARLMVINAAAGRALDHGFAAPPAINPIEGTGPIAAAKHAARLGRAITPRITNRV